MINIISSCTNSKKVTASPLLQINSYDSNMSIDDVLNIWKINTNSTQLSKYKPSDLYKGGSWKATIGTKKMLLTKFHTKLFIASAGYGLIEDTTEISAYDSTFASSTDSSIRKFIKNSSKQDNIDWWNSINTFELNTFSNNDYFFIILPYNYLYATQDTIKKIIEKFKMKVFIFRANKNTLPTFMSTNIINIDSRFNHLKPGVQSDMLQRAVLWLSEEIINKNIPLIHTDIQNHIDSTLEKYEKFSMPIREKLSEEILYIKIKSLIQEDNIQSASKGLKAFREMGFACEQKRFGKIFKDIKGGLI